MAESDRRGLTNRCGMQSARHRRKEADIVKGLSTCPSKVARPLQHQSRRFARLVHVFDNQQAETRKLLEGRPDTC